MMIAGDSVGWSLGWEPSDDLTRSVKIEDRAIIGCGVMPPASFWVVEGRGSEKYSAYCLEQMNLESVEFARRVRRGAAGVGQRS